MRNIGFALLAISILLGLVVVWGIRNITGPRVSAGTHLTQSAIVVASRPIGFGETLTPIDLRLQAWPHGAEPQGSFTSVDQLISQKRVALGPITANEPVLASRVSGPGGRATLSGVIRVGMRATTIRVNDVVGVAGFVLPGDVVDVLLTRSDGGKTNNDSATMRTDVLLQSVRVLAVDQLANENKNDPVVAKAATIEVTPDQAQKLALAAEVGTLSLALRGAVDPIAQPDQAAPGTTRVADLRLQGAPQPAPKRVVRVATHRPAGPPTPTIQIYRGSNSAVSVPAPQDAAAG